MEKPEPRPAVKATGPSALFGPVAHALYDANGEWVDRRWLETAASVPVNIAWLYAADGEGCGVEVATCALRQLPEGVENDLLLEVGLDHLLIQVVQQAREWGMDSGAVREVLGSRFRNVSSRWNSESVLHEWTTQDQSFPSRVFRFADYCLGLAYPASGLATIVISVGRTMGDGFELRSFFDDEDAYHLSFHREITQLDLRNSRGNGVLGPGSAAETMQLIREMLGPH